VKNAAVDRVMNLIALFLVSCGTWAT